MAVQSFRKYNGSLPVCSCVCNLAIPSAADQVLNELLVSVCAKVSTIDFACYQAWCHAGQWECPLGTGCQKFDEDVRLSMERGLRILQSVENRSCAKSGEDNLQGLRSTYAYSNLQPANSLCGSQSCLQKQGCQTVSTSRQYATAIRRNR